MNLSEIYTEKLEEFIHPYLNYSNHTNFSFASTHKDWKSLHEYMKDWDYNFLGISDQPPYNPYGERFNYAFVYEVVTGEDDCPIYWFHVSDRWINKIRKSLNLPEIEIVRK